MLSAFTLVVLIASGDAKDPVAQSMDKALHQALGAETNVIFRALPDGDAQALAVGRAERADAVVTIAWREQRVTLHVYSGDRWIDRDIGFAAVDADAERGRTLGFAIASMLPERAEPPPLPPAPPPPPPPPIVDRPVSIPPPPPPRFFLEPAFVGSAPGGLGGALHGGWRFLRAGVSMRFGDVDEAGASMQRLALSTGVRLRFVEPRPFGLALRAELLLLRDSLDRHDVSRGRWIPGSSSAIEGLYHLGSRICAFAALGAELGFGRTDVIVQGQRVVAIAPLRAIGELGLRFEM